MTEPLLPPAQYGDSFNEAHSGLPKARLIFPAANKSGPYQPRYEDSPHRLWLFKGRSPQWAWNIAVFEDGTVVQRDDVTQTFLASAKYVLWGGHQYDIVIGSWLYDTLVAAGYEFEEV